MIESHSDKKPSSDEKDLKKATLAGAGVSTAVLTKRLTLNPAKKLSSDLFLTYSKLSTLSFSKKLSRKDRETMDALRKAIVNLQKTVDKAQSDKTLALKKQFLNEKKSIEQLLNTLSLDKNKIKLRNEIMDGLKKLDKHVTIATPLDDPRVHEATALAVKTGHNPGYTITNKEDSRFTVKQGSTVGNTLAEAFSSMVLSKITQSANPENKSQTLTAHAFLAVKKLETKDQNATLEERCKKSLYVASQWSDDKGSFEACQLFGLKERKKAAGTRQVEDFNDLRQLNEACDLGLEKIIIPTALIADFDLHTENFMLKINDEHVAKENKEEFDHRMLHLKECMERTNYDNRQNRVNAIAIAIKRLKELGATAYFHKIDHDYGFYRYADPERKVDFSTHRTWPVYLEGMKPKIQPTLHVTEITGGTKEGFDQLLLSDAAIDRLLDINLDKEASIISETVDEFMKLIHEKAAKIGVSDAEKRAAEFYLLNEFYHHIASKNIKSKAKIVSDTDINSIKHEIEMALKRGTSLKVKDLHEQVYQRLLEKEKTGLSEKQSKLKSTLAARYPEFTVPSTKASSTPTHILRH